MKTSQIYVPGAQGPLKLSSGSEAIAISPIKLGGKRSYMLLSDGSTSSMEGSRIGGVGVKRFLENQGFVLANSDNQDAGVLADKLDIREGTKFVEDCLSVQAFQLTQDFGGKDCTFVPFDAENSPFTVKVEPSKGYTTTVYDMTSGFSDAQVAIQYNPEGSGGFGVALGSGWLVGPDVDAASMPRGTEFGGLVEKAVYILCNSGLGTLVGAKNLEMPEDAPIDAVFARGELKVLLNCGDHLTVGIDAVDELGVQYIRDSKVVYSRSGLEGSGRRGPNLGSAIGSIAAVLVRVAELDAVVVKSVKPARKALLAKAA